MAELDIATTPIRRDEVFFLFERRTARSSDNAYFVVRRELKPVIGDALRAQRSENVEIVFAEDGATYRLDPGPCRADGATMRFLERCLAAAALLVASAVAIDTVFALSAAKRRLQQEIVRFDSDLAAARQARSQIARIHETRQILDRTLLARRNPAELLDALSLALPDHAWLTDVRIADGIVEVVGISTAPMELPSLVSASSSFEKASFAGSVVKAVDQDGDRFTMRMDVSP